MTGRVGPLFSSIFASQIFWVGRKESHQKDDRLRKSPVGTCGHPETASLAETMEKPKKNSKKSIAICSGSEVLQTPGPAIGTLERNRNRTRQSGQSLTAHRLVMHRLVIHRLVMHRPVIPRPVINACSDLAPLADPQQPRWLASSVFVGKGSKQAWGPQNLAGLAVGIGASL